MSILQCDCASSCDLSTNRSVAEAFYKNVPDAQLVSRSDLSGNIWQLPCDKEINVTFKFGGVSFPINPLDTNIDLNATDSDGNHVCFGAVCFPPSALRHPPHHVSPHVQFQPMASSSDTYDAIFGMAFRKSSPSPLPVLR